MKKKENSETYTCAACGGTYTKRRSDATAMTESREIFGYHDDLAVVCDDCWQEMMDNADFVEASQ